MGDFKLIEFDQPENHLEKKTEIWKTGLIGNPTKDYDAKKAAQTIYGYMYHNLPHETVKEFQKITDEQPLCAR